MGKQVAAGFANKAEMLLHIYIKSPLKEAII